MSPQARSSARTSALRALVFAPVVGRRATGRGGRDEQVGPISNGDAGEDRFLEGVGGAAPNAHASINDGLGASLAGDRGVEPTPRPAHDTHGEALPVSREVESSARAQNRFRNAVVDVFALRVIPNADRPADVDHLRHEREQDDRGQAGFWVRLILGDHDAEERVTLDTAEGSQQIACRCVGGETGLTLPHDGVCLALERRRP